MEKVNTMNITTEINKLITNLQKSNNDKLKKENDKLKWEHHKQLEQNKQNEDVMEQNEKLKKENEELKKSQYIHLLYNEANDKAIIELKVENEKLKNTLKHEKEWIVKFEEDLEEKDKEIARLSHGDLFELKQTIIQLKEEVNQLKMEIGDPFVPY